MSPPRRRRTRRSGSRLVGGGRIADHPCSGREWRSPRQALWGSARCARPRQRLFLRSPAPTRHARRDPCLQCGFGRFERRACSRRKRGGGSCRAGERRYAEKVKLLKASRRAQGRFRRAAGERRRFEFSESRSRASQGAGQGRRSSDARAGQAGDEEIGRGAQA